MSPDSHLFELGAAVVKTAILIGAVLTAVAYLTYTERRVSALIQDRLGPNRVGPFGLLQPLADGIKFIFKEDTVPSGANKIIYSLAPAFSFVTALAALAVIPIGRGFETDLMGLLPAPVFISFQIADIDAGALYVFAVSSLSVYGVILGGWASNSKYSLIGGIRGISQMISYELALGLSVIGVFVLVGSLRINDIVEYQSGVWLMFSQFFGFIIFLIASFAETNRLPFDVPEAEPEIVGGYHTEYSGMKFAMFFMAEYTHMIVASCLITALYLGGWYPLPFFGWGGIDIETHWYLPPIVFLGKVAAMLFFFIWVRWTLPRFRSDQIMAFGWKVLLPLSVANIFGTAVYVALKG
ncbi:MAG: NADH-quinone oxidoreductase subunit NuoH [Candidatus Mycalebacterium zealandia]|nr:MAG: NADH-quinone oxidoreductase subunit NuoH [Candidatus Mycalebacterium zealandia]